MTFERIAIGFCVFVFGLMAGYAWAWWVFGR